MWPEGARHRACPEVPALGDEGQFRDKKDFAASEGFGIVPEMGPRQHLDPLTFLLNFSELVWHLT